MKILMATLIVGSLMLVAQSQKQSEAPKQEAQSQSSATPQAPTSIGQVLDRQISGLERQLVPLVEAMPEEKFAFKPPQSAGEFKDVRTFSEQVKHVATGMHMLAATQMGQKSPYTTEIATLGPPELRAKTDIVKFLKDGFAAAHSAAKLLNEKNALEMLESPFGPQKMSRLAQANIVVWHGFDHYGQMVIYARMNGIVPPASRNN